MKPRIYLLFLLLFIVFSGCENPANETPDDQTNELNQSGDPDIDDLKGFINFIPTVISLDPTESSTASGIARGIGDDDLTGGFDFELMTDLLVAYSELISAGIRVVKSELEIADTLVLNEVITLNRIMTMSSSVPGTTTLNKYKYNLTETELILWLNSTLDMGSDKLDIDCKITVSSSAYKAQVSFYQYSVSLEDEYVEGNYDYWELTYNDSEQDLSIIEITPDQIEFYTKAPNSDGKYDFIYDRNNIPPLTDPDGISVILCRDAGIYASDYSDDTISGIAIFNTDLSFVGQDIGSTPITFGSESDISIANYVSHWPSDYTSLKNAHASLLVTKEADIRASITEGNYFPHSEFSDL